jgi:hypothetical protein
MARDCTQGQKCYNCKLALSSVEMSHTDNLQVVKSVISAETVLQSQARSVSAINASSLATFRTIVPTLKDEGGLEELTTGNS